MDAKKQYHRDYYHNKYKSVISGKKEFCHCCSKEVSSWNLYKHKNSKKHKFNGLSEEEKNRYLEDRERLSIIKKINKLDDRLEQLM